MGGWFSFSKSEQFHFWTGYPRIEMEIFDAELDEFIPMFTSGGLEVDSVSHPWIIVRARTLQDRECKDLTERIGSLSKSRAGARELLAGYGSIFANKVDVEKKRATRTDGGRRTAVGVGRRIAAGVDHGNPDIAQPDTSAAEPQEIGGISRSGTAFSLMVIDVDKSSSGSDYVEEDGSTDSSDSDEDSDEMDMDEEMKGLKDDGTETVADIAAIARDLTSTAGMSTNSFDL